MAKILRGDLQSSAISQAIALLDQESTECNKLSRAIDEFINSSKDTLKGPEYDAARDKMQSFINIMSIRNKVATNLSSSIQSAVDVMKEYMADDSLLDDDDIEKYEAEIETLSSEKNSISITRKDTAAEKSSKRSRISQIEDEIRELNKKIEKLKLLQPTDQSAYGIISDMKGQENNYNSEISSYQVTNL